MLLLLVLALFAGCTEETGRGELSPPVAEPRPRSLLAHGHIRIDDYYWLAERSPQDPAIQALLAAENAYTEQSLVHVNDLRRELHQELALRFSAEDTSTPIRHGSYDYFRRYVKEGDMPVYLRRHTENGMEQVLLDLNRMARNQHYYQVANWAVSEDEQLLAYVEDRVGQGLHTLRIKDLHRNQLLGLQVDQVAASLAWAADSTSLFYVAREASGFRPDRVYRLDLDRPDEPQQVYQEKDPAFAVHLYPTRSGDFIVIMSTSAAGTEARLIHARQPRATPVLLQERIKGHEYNLQHDGETFFIRTNWQAAGFRIMTSRRIAGLAEWQELVPPSPGVMLDDFEVFPGHLVLSERQGGLAHIRILDRRNLTWRRLLFDEPAYMVRIGVNPRLDSDKVRLIYSSLTSPDSVYEVPLAGGERRLVKQDQILGGFESENYLCERLLLPARDDRLVPVSLVYRRDTDLKRAPLAIHGYGAYGVSVEPRFQADRLSLLDRGFIYAIAHVRGGEEMGHAWYEGGRRHNKWNSFHDFIDVTRELTDLGYGDADRVFATGASAGGLLMSVVANEAPELFVGLVVHAPFTDVLTSMLDESLPLTAGDFAEWGDPRKIHDYNYILSYSPYDQIKRQAYPHILVTTGLQDIRVSYYDPVKWVQKLRALKTDRNRILMDIDMQSGHGGPVSQGDRFRRQALIFAFMLDLAAKTEAKTERRSSWN